METREIFYRLRSGIALILSLLCGRLSGSYGGDDYSTYFIAGFVLSFAAIRILFYFGLKLKQDDH